MGTHSFENICTVLKLQTCKFKWDIKPQEFFNRFYKPSFLEVINMFSFLQKFQSPEEKFD